MEDLAQVAHRGHHRVKVAHPHRAARCGHVDRLGGEALLEVSAAERLEPAADRSLHLGTHLVRHATDGGPFLGGNGAESLQEDGQLAGAAEQRVAQVIDGIAAGGGGQAIDGGRAEGLEVGEEVAHRVSIGCGVNHR
jgi:hypothetical protein